MGRIEDTFGKAAKDIGKVLHCNDPALCKTPEACVKMNHCMYKTIVIDLKKEEKVNHPAHYGGADNPYETIKVLEAWATDTEFYGFLKLTIIKYQSRLGKKDTPTTDLAKAIWYSEYLKNWLQKTSYVPESSV